MWTSDVIDNGMHDFAKQKWRQAYMDTAWTFSKLSVARRLQVGAVIVKNHRIISIGYNGTPPKWDNDCENLVEVNGEFQYVTKPEVIHAEANAILKLARDGESGKGSMLFCTHAPCIECAKMILTVGIGAVFWSDSYKVDDGLNFLISGGVGVYNMPRLKND